MNSSYSGVLRLITVAASLLSVASIGSFPIQLLCNPTSEQAAAAAELGPRQAGGGRSARAIGRRRARRARRR